MTASQPVKVRIHLPPQGEGEQVLRSSQDRSYEGRSVRKITTESSPSFLSRAARVIGTALLVACIVTMPALAAGAAAFAPQQQECKEGICSDRTITQPSSTSIVPAPVKEPPPCRVERWVYPMGGSVRDDAIGRQIGNVLDYATCKVEHLFPRSYVAREQTTDIPYIVDMSTFTPPVVTGYDCEDRPFIFIQLENQRTKRISTLVFHDTKKDRTIWKVSNPDTSRSCAFDWDYIGRFRNLLQGTTQFLPSEFPLDDAKDNDLYKLYKCIPRS